MTNLCLPRGVLTNSVLVPKQGKDEVDVEMKASVGMHISECLDDGEMKLRESQEQAIFDAAREQILGGFVQKEEAVDLWQPASALPGNERASGSRAAPEIELESGGDQSEADDSGSDDET